MSAAPVLAQMKKITLEVGSGPLKGQSFEFAKPVITIGRGSENDIVLEKDAKASRTHLEIRQAGGTITLRNVSDKNTVLHNGQLIKVATVYSESQILVGESEMFLKAEGLPPRSAPRAPAPALAAARAPGAPAPIGSAVPSAHGAGAPAPYTAGAPPTSYSPGSPYPGVSVGGGKQGSSRTGLYVVFGILLIGGAWIFSTNHTKKLIAEIRTTEEVDKDVQTSTETAADIEKRLQKEGKGTIQYEMAQEQYIRGFRDYRQGQYARALQSLRAAIAFFPQHELARRYLTLAQKKLDEMVKLEMDLGKKYRGQENYRLCSASFRKVVMIIGDENDPVAKEAAQYMRECDLQQRERY